MTKQLIRIGIDNISRQKKILKAIGFDMLFDGRHELVYIPNYEPWMFVNGSWTGALGHLMNGTQLNWMRRYLFSTQQHSV
jgi:hypothetical protein